MLLSTSYLHLVIISPAFIEDGFNSWKKAVEKFSSHDTSHTIREAKMKRLALGQLALSERFDTQTSCTRRKALLTQLEIPFMTTQCS